MPSVPTILLAAGAAVALVGCGGSGNRAAATSTSHPSPGQAPAAGTGQKTITVTVPAHTTSTDTTGRGAVAPAGSNDHSAAVTGGAPQAPAAGGACAATSMTLLYLGGQGATGHGELGFALRNTGPSCHTFGYPGVEFLDAAGNPLATSPVRTTRDFFGQSPEARVQLTPGRSVSFRLGVTHGAASSAGCVTVYGLSVIPPDDTQSLRVAIPGGALECGGAVTVSPVRPGGSAYP